MNTEILEKAVKFTYDIDYFIKKFEAIPDDKWAVRQFVDFVDNEKRCALGHCGRNYGNIYGTEESSALVDIFLKNDSYVSRINDGADSNFIQSRPKTRILAALRKFKENEKN